MHILHVFSSFGAGGPQLRIATIINALGPEWQHTVIAMDGKFDARFRVAPGASITYLESPPRRSHWPRVLALRQLVRKTAPDLLVTYNWGAIEAVAVGVWEGICPVIHHEHGFGPDEADALKLRRVLARRFLLNRIQLTLVPSMTLLDIALKRYRLRSERVRFIPNGVDMAKFKPRRNPELRARWGAGGGAVVFGYVGNLRPEKNLALLLRAFAAARIPNARLALIGDGSCRRELEILASDLALGEQIMFAGSTLDPAAYYAAIDVFVLSSVTEQMPMSLLEAMACGLPAIVTDVGDSAELLGNPGRPSVVPSRDLEAYIAALGTLARDRGLREAMGRENRTRCAANYGADRMIREYAGEFLAAAGVSSEKTTVCPGK